MHSSGRNVAETNLSKLIKNLSWCFSNLFAAKTLVVISIYFVMKVWKHGDCMVSELSSGLSSLGLSPGQTPFVLILGRTLYSHSASLHPAVQLSCWGSPCDGLAFHPGGS